MINYSRLIRSDIDMIRECGALTQMQSRIFDVMLAGRLTRSDAAEELGMSYSKFHAAEQILGEKIERILEEKSAKNQI
ncbi:MAG: hypothetical protein J1G30_04295 [Spirochaetales bacterium]|nr:hypothetical protein [Spirochaetales bacterium]